MLYAEVAVNSHVHRRDQTFSYAVPSFLERELAPGHLVIVPFGKQRLQGVIASISSHAPAFETREIAALLDPRPVISAEGLALARWMSHHYYCSLSEAVIPMLPSGLRQRPRRLVELTSAGVESPLKGLSPNQKTIMTALRDRASLAVDDIRAQLGVVSVTATLRRLEKAGLIRQRWELEPARARTRLEPAARLLVQPERVDELVSTALRRSPRQAAALFYLAGHHDSPVTFRELRAESGASRAAILALESRGLVALEDLEVRSDPLAGREFPRGEPPLLNVHQGRAWQAISASLEKPGSRVFLLHGVTSSGKTEIYMRAIARVLRTGRQAIVLVPEISLTPQAIDRFAARFPGLVGIWHSKLSTAEQYDQWRRIRSGDIRIVIGSRSAIFTPVQSLGLIVVDEEHEWSYKEDRSTRYHARDVAIKLGELAGATVILASATPDVESYYRAQQGKYHLLSLPVRVAAGRISSLYSGPAKGSDLPPVKIVDLREELKQGNRGLFSRPLKDAISATLKENMQAILFLNRRGTATSVVCRTCGYVIGCGRCAVPMVYHAAEGEMICHRCDARSAPPQTCPSCGSRRIKQFGVGTQKIEQEVLKLFPGARVVRWDHDVARGKGAHERVFDQLSRHEADILVGTQMIAKGLDLPLVKLVGVVLADTGLHLPDLRAGERTFQVLAQVAGRAGRHGPGGRVIIQTYSPLHYCIRAAAKHDYEGFYRQEVHFRQRYGYPPFKELVKFVYSASRDFRAREEAERLARILHDHIERSGISGASVVGPAPAFVHKLRGRYRWQLLARVDDSAALLDKLSVPPGWVVDVDPASLL